MQGAPSSQEEQKSALEQYGVNLTEIAKQGKLDPVIGVARTASAPEESGASGGAPRASDPPQPSIASRHGG